MSGILNDCNLIDEEPAHVYRDVCILLNLHHRELTILCLHECKQSGVPDVKR